jgi:5'(3')-deoxyribonucleotidase
MVTQNLAVVFCQSYDMLQIDALIHDIYRNLKEAVSRKPLEQQHGSILTLGYTVG